MPTNILLDTNALWMKKDDRSRLTQACRSGRIRAYLPALVVVERERQLLQTGCVRFAQGRIVDSEIPVRWFRQWVIDLAQELGGGELAYQPILAFDEEQAHQVGIAWREYLTTQSHSYILNSLSAEAAIQAWRERYKNKHPVLADLDWLVHKADWSIAAVARHTGWPIVTDDTDPPFRQAGVITLTWSEFATQYLSHH